MRLTKTVVEALEPRDRDRFHWDDQLPGFGVKITPKGQRIYVFQYRSRSDRTSRRYTLGRHGSPWTTQKAREAAEMLLLRVRSGEDPVASERAARAAAQEAESVAERERFETVVHTFIERYAQPKNRTWRATKRILEHDAVSAWAGRPLSSISRRDVITLVDAVTARSPTSGRALFAQLRRLFAWSVERLYIEQSPLQGLRAPPPAKPRDRWLSDGEIRLLWRSLDALGGALAPLFKILLLTGQRREEVSEMAWSELDLDRAEWIIPARRSKNGRAHAVDLAPAVVALLKALPRRHRLVFTTTGDSAPSGHAKYRDRLLLKMRALRAEEARAAGEATYAMTRDWRVHDLRRTAATGMARLGYPPHVIEAVLNHSSGVRGGLVAVYQHFDHRPERRAALAAWAEHVSQLGRGGEPLGSPPPGQLATSLTTSNT